MDDLPIKDGIVIPSHELEISASRSGGAGGQHVNKTNSRITVRWNLYKTNALNEEHKQRLIDKLRYELTSDGELLVTHSSSRSQHDNKQAALKLLAEKLRKALHIPKKRIKGTIPHQAKETRLQRKKQHSALKKMRRTKFDID